MKKNLTAIIFLILIGILFRYNFNKHSLYNPLTINQPVVNKQPLAFGRVETDLSQHKKKLMVALTFGQSNSANYGETRYSSTENVFNYFRGKIYLAKDPLLGADGINGSVWTRLGDKLIKKKLYQNIIFVPIGVGGSSIAQWSPGGNLHKRLLHNIRHVKRSGLKFTHLLWHQGESDAYPLRTPKNEYKYHFKKIIKSIREEGVEAPIYISIASNSKLNGNNEVATAQKELVNNIDILLGPNTDKLGPTYRYDGVHFTTEGLEKFSNSWVKILSSN